MEGVLEALYRQGVYLTVDELKGRRPVIRGATTIPLDPVALRNPLTAGPLHARTSGSGGARRRFRWISRPSAIAQ